MFARLFFARTYRSDEDQGQGRSQAAAGVQADRSFFAYRTSDFFFSVDRPEYTGSEFRG
jgi:hypothetical protein